MSHEICQQQHNKQWDKIKTLTFFFLNSRTVEIVSIMKLAYTLKFNASGWKRWYFFIKYANTPTDKICWNILNLMDISLKFQNIFHVNEWHFISLVSRIRFRKIVYFKYSRKKLGPITPLFYMKCLQNFQKSYTLKNCQKGCMLNNILYCYAYMQMSEYEMNAVFCQLHQKKNVCFI